nr:GNAT family N-acetyltransferase [Isoptericola sediminis]
MWRASDLTRPWNDPYRDIADARAHPAATVLVARDGDVVVGSVLAGYEGHRGWLYDVAVDPGRRTTGLGYVDQETRVLGRTLDDPRRAG